MKLDDPHALAIMHPFGTYWPERLRHRTMRPLDIGDDLGRQLFRQVRAEHECVAKASHAFHNDIAIGIYQAGAGIMRNYA